MSSNAFFFKKVFTQPSLGRVVALKKSLKTFVNHGFSLIHFFFADNKPREGCLEIFPNGCPPMTVVSLSTLLWVLTQMHAPTSPLHPTDANMYFWRPTDLLSFGIHFWIFSWFQSLGSEIKKSILSTALYSNSPPWIFRPRVPCLFFRVSAAEKKCLFDGNPTLPRYTQAICILFSKTIFIWRPADFFYYCLNLNPIAPLIIEVGVPRSTPIGKPNLLTRPPILGKVKWIIEKSVGRNLRARIALSWLHCKDSGHIKINGTL